MNWQRVWNWMDKVTYNAPVIIAFTGLAMTVLILLIFLGPQVLMYFSASGEFDLLSPLFYFGMFSYVLGHANVSHFVGNFMIILLAGPLLEEKKGSKNLLIMILVTVVLSSLLNALLFSHRILGASGVAFMMLIMASCGNVRRGEIPLTLVLAVMLYGGRELSNIFIDDNVSQFGHIVGGICGGAFGLLWHPKKDGANIVSPATYPTTASS